MRRSAAASTPVSASGVGGGWSFPLITGAISSLASLVSFDSKDDVRSSAEAKGTFQGMSC